MWLFNHFPWPLRQAGRQWLQLVRSTWQLGQRHLFSICKSESNPSAQRVQMMKTDCHGPFWAPRHARAWEGSADTSSRSATLWSILLAWATCHPSSINTLQTASENNVARLVWHGMWMSRAHQTQTYAIAVWDLLRSLSAAVRGAVGWVIHPCSASAFVLYS